MDSNRDARCNEISLSSSASDSEEDDEDDADCSSSPIGGGCLGSSLYIVVIDLYERGLAFAGDQRGYVFNRQNSRTNQLLLTY